MKQGLIGLLLLASIGCHSSTGPIGFILHAEVVNKTSVPNHWANTRFTWAYVNAQHLIITSGFVTIQSDSQCITPPVAPPTTTSVSFDVQGYGTLFAPTEPDWTVTYDSAGATSWTPGLAHPCR